MTTIILNSVYLNQCFSYDPETGSLKWKERPASHFATSKGRNVFNGKFTGREAGIKQFRRGGQKHHIRVEFTCDGGRVTTTAHRIIATMTGLILGAEIVDHEDGNPFNNKKKNLRVASQHQSARNRGEFRRFYNLPKGVYPDKRGKFQAKITFNRRQIFLGLHDTPEKASEVYESKASELFKDFYREKC